MSASGGNGLNSAAGGGVAGSMCVRVDGAGEGATYVVLGDV